MKRLYPVNENYFEKFNEDSSYLLGLICADGNIELNKNSNPCRLNISLKREDISLLEIVKQKLEFAGPVKIYSKKLNGKIFPQAILRISSRILCQKLFNIGIINKKSLCLKPLKQLPPIYIKDFIRGYFDGDGSICTRKDNGYLKLEILGTKEILHFIQTEFSKIYKKVGSLTQRKNIFSLQFNGNKSCLCFLDWIYDNSSELFLDRKKGKYLNFKSKL